MAQTNQLYAMSEWCGSVVGNLATVDYVVMNGSTIWTRVPPTPGVITYGSERMVGETLRLSWAAAARATSYTVQYLAPGGNWTTWFTQTGTTYDWSIFSSGLWQFRVLANGAGGTSSYTSATSITATPAQTQFVVSDSAVDVNYTGYSNYPGKVYGTCWPTTVDGKTVKAAFYTGTTWQLFVNGDQRGWDFTKVIINGVDLLRTNCITPNGYWLAGSGVTRYSWTTARPTGWVEGASGLIWYLEPAA